MIISSTHCLFQCCLGWSLITRLPLQTSVCFWAHLYPHSSASSDNIFRNLASLQMFPNPCMLIKQILPSSTNALDCSSFTALCWGHQSFSSISQHRLVVFLKLQQISSRLSIPLIDGVDFSHQFEGQYRDS